MCQAYCVAVEYRACVDAAVENIGGILVCSQQRIGCFVQSSAPETLHYGVCLNDSVRWVEISRRSVICVQQHGFCIVQTFLGWL